MKLKCNSCDGIYNDSLDVRFTKACDNACAFCIERSGLETLGPTQVDAMIESTLRSGKSTILILGGEPFLQIAKLHAYVTAIRPYVKEIFITTSLPKQLDVRDERVCDILLAIDGLNVSLQHYDPKINNQILLARSDHDRIEQLESILYVMDATKVRISINLVDGSIDTKAKLLTCLDVLKNIGAKFVKINELQHSNEFVSFEDIMGVKLPPAYSSGCQREVDIYNGLRVLLKRSCFFVEPSLAPSVTDIIKLAIQRVINPKTTCTVLYEDGSIAKGWRSKKAI